MTTGIFNAGYPLDDRSPAPNLFRPSTWAPNVFFCQLAQLAGDALVASVFNQTGVTPIPVFFFTQDAPCVVMASSRYTGIRLVDSGADTLDIPQLHFFEACQQVGNVDAAPITAVLAGASVTPADAEQGERISGNTFTNAVGVTGYAYEIPLLDQSLQDDDPADITPTIHMMVVTQSGVVYGPNSTGTLLSYDGTGVAHADRASVILRESDYTAAMRAAGNVYTDTNGLQFNIMGLHAIPAAA